MWLLRTDMLKEAVIIIDFLMLINIPLVVAYILFGCYKAWTVSDTSVKARPKIFTAGDQFFSMKNL